MDKPSQQIKRCSRCGEIKPLDDFHRNRSRPDGVQNVCRECKKFYTSRFVSLDQGNVRGRFREINLHGVIWVETVPPDDTWVKAVKAIRHWISDGTISKSEGAALYMYAVVGLEASEIAVYAHCAKTTVFNNYHRAVTKLQARYASELQAQGA